MSKIYVFHTDAAHGWLSVKRSELVRLGILDKISHFSYQKGNSVYLEEDCDASVFWKAKQERGEEFETRESYSNRSPVRSYPHFSPRN